MMIAIKTPYKTGTWFGVPLRSSGYACGVIARIGKGGILFGYFFGPRLNSLPVDVPEGVCHDDHVLWGMFGDNGLINGKWIIIGNDSNWRNEDWPIPPMVRVDEHAGIAFMSKYDDSTLEFIFEERCGPSLLDSHPYDRLMGHGAVEIRLTKLLN
ncbi:MAG: hypothetical protein GY696_01810 [Gammaproteobacteria bacterium]|nr:hypothetical protein [Gammaproteobacteria bacterium]